MKTLICLLGIIVPSMGNAQYNLESSDFEYSHPFENKLHNNSSIDFRTFSNKSSAIQSPVGWLTQGGAISTTLVMKIVDDFSSLDETLDINTSVSLAAEYLISSGSLSVEYKSNNFYKTDERTISIIIKLESYYGKYGYLDPELKQNARQIIDSGQYDTFIRTYGTHFVSHSDNVVRALAVINIRNLDHSTKRKLIADFKSKVEGSYGDISGSASATMNLQHLINTAKKVSTVEVSLHAVGAGGPPALSDFIQSIDNASIKEILAGFASFAKTGTKENSAPIKFYLSPYHRYGLEFNKSYSFDEGYLNDLHQALLTIRSTINQLKNISEIRSKYKPYYTQLLEYYNQEWNIHTNLLTQCINNNQCSRNLSQLKKVAWPYNITIDEDFKIQPTYLPTSNSTGGKDRILYNITIRLEGYILFPEFFNRIEFYYLDETNKLVSIPNFVAGDRIIVDQNQVNYGNINSRQFLAQVDTKSAQFEFNDKGEVPVTQNNINSSNKIIEELSRREYYIKTYSIDGFESTTYIGSLNLSEVATIK